MKLRIVEYRLDPHGHELPSPKSGSTQEIIDSEAPLDTYDPGVTDGWTRAITARHPLEVRGRMFYDVDSISRVESEMADERLSGESYEVEFARGECITVHSALVAESEAEVSL